MKSNVPYKRLTDDLKNYMGGVIVVDGFEPESDLSNETNHGSCKCGHGFIVSDQYNYHADGVLHGRDKCEAFA